MCGALICPRHREFDRLGERAVLAAEAVLLIFVCFGYGFSRFIFPEGTAFFITCACYLLDQMLMSVGMARSTYMKKIALQPSHIQPALAAGVTIDHIFSISAALVGGVIWNRFGFQYVFLYGDEHAEEEDVLESETIPDDPTGERGTDGEDVVDGDPGGESRLDVRWVEGDLLHISGAGHADGEDHLVEQVADAGDRKGHVLWKNRL